MYHSSTRELEYMYNPSPHFPLRAGNGYEVNKSMFRISKRKAEKKRVLLGGRCPWLHLPHLPFENNKNNKNIRYIPNTARSSGFLSQLLVVGGEEVFLLVKLHPHSRPDCRGGRGPKLLLPHPCLSPCHCRRPLHSIGISSII